MERQTDMAERSAVFAQTALKNTERADVLLESAGIVFSGTRQFDGDARLVLRYKNFGRTRANRVIVKARMIIPETAIDAPAHPVPTMVMGAGQEQSVSFQRFREFLRNEDFQRIVLGSTVLRFEGWIVYEDVFGDSYTTRNVGLFDHRTLSFRMEESLAG
jgi:hypothetical protein